MTQQNEAASQLDYFLFRNVHNGFVADENKWAVTYSGDEFLVLHRESGEMFNFTCSIVPSTNLTDEEKARLANEQEWFEDEWND